MVLSQFIQDANNLIHAPSILETFDWTEALNGLASLSIIVVSIVALFGVNSWRKEIREKRKYELGEEVLALFYEARDVLNYIRNPLSYANEGKSRGEGESETPTKKAIYDSAFVPIERYNNHVEVFSKLQTLRYRFMGIFEKESAEPFDKLNKMKTKILVSANRLAELRMELNELDDDNSKHGENKSRAARLKYLTDEIIRYEAVIWIAPDPDQIADTVDKAIEVIEATCKKVVTESKVKLFFFKSRRIQY